MKKIWYWVKALFNRLFGKKKVANQAVITPQITRFTHNMPKRQPCPLGHGWKKRLEKTLGGALYWCNRCKSSFLVRA